MWCNYLLWRFSIPSSVISTPECNWAWMCKNTWSGRPSRWGCRSCHLAPAGVLGGCVWPDPLRETRATLQLEGISLKRAGHFQVGRARERRISPGARGPAGSWNCRDGARRTRCQSHCQPMPPAGNRLHLNRSALNHRRLQGLHLQDHTTSHRCDPHWTPCWTECCCWSGSTGPPTEEGRNKKEVLYCSYTPPFKSLAITLIKAAILFNNNIQTQVHGFLNLILEARFPACFSILTLHPLYPSKGLLMSRLVGSIVLGTGKTLKGAEWGAVHRQGWDQKLVFVMETTRKY